MSREEYRKRNKGSLQQSILVLTSMSKLITSQSWLLRNTVVCLIGAKHKTILVLHAKVLPCKLFYKCFKNISIPFNLSYTMNNTVHWRFSTTSDALLTCLGFAISICIPQIYAIIFNLLHKQDLTWLNEPSFARLQNIYHFYQKQDVMKMHSSAPLQYKHLFIMELR